MALTTPSREPSPPSAAPSRPRSSCRPPRRWPVNTGTIRGRCGEPTPTTTTSTRVPSSTPSTTASAASRPTSTSSATDSSSPTIPARTLDPSRTLESLYLDPLTARVRAHHGSVYRWHRTPLQLLIDIKTEGAPTYLELHRHLRRYRHLFTTYAGGRVLPGPVTAVISGDRAARTPMEAQRVRHAFYDGRLADLGGPARSSLIPLISDNWTLHFTWQGVGAFPAAERRKLHDIGGRRARDHQARKSLHGLLRRCHGLIVTCSPCGNQWLGVS
ncbi:hypothetical protein SHIRM173S_04742 [Streptomyces hirsutus]